MSDTNDNPYGLEQAHTFDSPVADLDADTKALRTLIQEVARLGEQVETLNRQQTEILTVMQEIKQKAQPMLDKLAASPVFKMMTGG